MRAAVRFGFLASALYALTVGELAGCSYDYDALMGAGNGGANANPGTAGNPGIAGATGGGGGSGGPGGAGAASGAGGAVSGTAGTTGEGGAAGTGSAGGRGGEPGMAGRGGEPGMGGRGGTAGGGGSGGSGARGGAGGTGGGAGGRGGAAGSAGAGGRGGASGSGQAGSGGRGGAAGSAGASGGAGATGNGGVSGGAGGRAGSGGGGAGGRPDADLVLWYKFDDGSGTIALDSSTTAGAPRNGMLLTGGTGGAVGFSTTHQVGTHAVNLTANGITGGGYVTAPSLHDLAPAALTISTWVYVTTSQKWQRVFDIGNTTTSNLALTTQNGTDQVRFVIRTGGVEQPINSTVILSLAAWHHIAVVLPEGATYTGSLYVDGVLVATNTAMTFHASDLGATVNNFIGRSQFADPYFAGSIDDFRVYRRALSAEQVTAVFNAR